MRSVPRTPVSQYVIRSGMSNICSAADHEVDDCDAISWYSVVKGRCCSPLMAYSSSAGTTAPSLSAMPSVRLSRWCQGLARSAPSLSSRPWSIAHESIPTETIGPVSPALRRPTRISRHRWRTSQR